LAKTIKAKVPAAPAPVTPAPEGNRYCRAARTILAHGAADIDIATLTAQGFSPSSARYCIEAFIGVCQALREAGLLPAEVASPAAEQRPETPEEGLQAA
jgi:hypothetical protein